MSNNSMNTNFVPTRRRQGRPYMPALVAFAAVILLIVLYFALVRPLVNSGGEEEPPVTTGPGEGVQYDLGTLYPSIKRSEMKVIRVHNADGTYEFRRMSMVYIRPFRGVKTMLRELRRVGKVYLLSNAQSCFTINELKECGLYDLFDDIIISSDVGRKKPYGEIFDIAFDRFGITAENSIYVGNDMRDDILGATRGGMRTLYIDTAQSGRYPDLDIPAPTFVAKNHKQMKDILLSLTN